MTSSLPARFTLLALAAASAQAAPPQISFPASGPALLRTATAEFLLARDGGIRARLGQEDALGAAALGQRVAGAPIQLDFSKATVHGDRVDLPWRGAAGLSGSLAVEAPEAEPGALTAVLTVHNGSARGRDLGEVVVLGRRMAGAGLYSFQGASYDWGAEELLPIKAGLHRPNVMGAMVKGGYGGGIPVVAFWNRAQGEALGTLDGSPCAIPVAVDGKNTLETSVTFRPGTVAPGGSWTSPPCYLSVYRGDFYEPLRQWAALRRARGWKPAAPSPEAYQASWCSWGYGFDVTPALMLGVVPKLKELGITWTTVDDRWFDAYGDWRPRRDTFPGRAMQTMVQDLHRAGEKVQLWWLPLGAEDGRGRWDSHPYVIADVVKEHPEWLVLDAKGRHARMTRNLAVLDPSLPEVQAYFRKLTETFIRAWDCDGLKLDNIYTVPPCFNPLHHHRSPQESTAAVGELYRIIFATAHALKPEAVVQACPCGTTPAADWVGWMDQPVTADPVGAVQVRRRIKMYKALLGAQAAVYGDHVELSRMSPMGKGDWLETGEDFASTIGAGGVVGTKFVWPPLGVVPKSGPVDLTPARDAVWKHWLAIHNAQQLASGTFLNLYTYGFDVPEAYAIAKDGRMHYGFFAEGAWQGPVELRGLAPGAYRVRDYAEGRDLGRIEAVAGRTPQLEVAFTDHLLLEVVKQ